MFGGDRWAIELLFSHRAECSLMALGDDERAAIGAAVAKSDAARGAPFV